MKPNFRHTARLRLKAAKGLLEICDAVNVVYAALELRMAMEAVNYSLAEAYARELSVEGWRTWQPKKLMEMLLEIDPFCGHDSTIAVGVEETPGVESSNMRVIGTDRKLDLKTIKRHYDALGSYLHVPTMDQLANGHDHNITKLRKRCLEILEWIDVILSSSVFNCTLGQFAEINCSNCGSALRRRVTHLGAGDSTIAKCASCGLQYTIRKNESDQYLWQELTTNIVCPHEECAKNMYVRTDQILAGSRLTCPHCGKRGQFGLAVVKL